MDTPNALYFDWSEWREDGKVLKDIAAVGADNIETVVVHGGDVVRAMHVLMEFGIVPAQYGGTVEYVVLP